MTFPLYMKDAFAYPTGLVLAVLIGFGFGFVLERSGFGRSTVLAAQFYFRDMRVLKVMFSAIVTALLGMTLLSGVGLLDMKALQVPPTFLWPQLVGGLLLGAGFIVSGYCPGTAVVAIASGKLDGLAAVAGVMAGSLAFGFAHPWIEDFYMSGSMGTFRLPDALGAPQAILALAVALMAIGAFVGAEKVERIFADRDRTERSAPRAASTRRVFAGFAVASILGLLTLLAPRGDEALAERPFRRIDPLAFAELAVEDPAAFLLVDLRSPAPPAEERIPGAIPLPEEGSVEAFFAGLPATRTLILCADAEVTRPPAATARFPGDVAILEGGYAAFRDLLLRPPEPPADAREESMARFKKISALHAYFSGSEARVETPAIQPRAAARAGAKKGGGC